jgi:hypothetical protein
MELRSQPSGVRITVAAIAAPSIVPIAYFLIMRFVSGYTLQGPGHTEKLLDLTMKGILIPSYLLSYVFGGVIFFVLKKFRRLSFLTWLGSSGVCGACIGVFIVLRDTSLLELTASDAFAAMVFCLPFAIAGCLTCSIFWWMAKLGTRY